MFSCTWAHFQKLQVRLWYMTEMKHCSDRTFRWYHIFNILLRNDLSYIKESKQCLKNEWGGERNGINCPTPPSIGNKIALLLCVAIKLKLYGLFEFEIFCWSCFFAVLGKSLKGRKNKNDCGNFINSICQWW